jgi:hypothetical protein
LMARPRRAGEAPRRLTLDTEYGVKGRRAGACGAEEWVPHLFRGGGVESARDGSEERAAQAKACGSGERTAQADP